MLRVAVVGFGAMGKNHARVLSKISEVELVAIIDELLAGTFFNSLCVEKSIDHLLAMNIDYAVISVPTSMHFAVASRLASAGINCLIEKPVTSTQDEAEKLSHLFESNGLIAAVGHIERYNPAIMELQKKVAEGLLGEIYQISTRRIGPFPGRIRDVGVVKDLASHDIDLCRWLTGSNYAQVHAVTLSPSGREYEDLLSATGAMSNGVVVNHLINWVSPYKERSTSVLGEKGMLVADTLNVELYFHANGVTAGDWQEISLFKGVSEGDSTRFALERNEPLLTEHLNFIRAIKGAESAAIVSLEDGLETLKVADAMLSISSK